MSGTEEQASRRRRHELRRSRRRGPRLPARPRGKRAAATAVASAARPANDHLDRRPDLHHRPGPVAAPELPPRRAAGAHRQRKPVAAAARVRHLLRRLPAARLALGDPAAWRGHRDQRSRLDRDHLHQLAGQLPGAGQARRRLSRLPAQGQQRHLDQQDVRHDLHRARLRPLRDRAAGTRCGLLELPHGHVARGPAGLRDRPCRHRRACESACS